MSFPRDALENSFRAAVRAAQPDAAVAASLPEPPRGRTVVLGAGKAGATMARAFERAYARPVEGVVVVPYGHAGEVVPYGHAGAPGRGIRVLEAAHPVPDESGVRATREVLAMLDGLDASDLVVCLVSGGGSALLCAPEGVTLAEKAALTADLLRSGAPIGDLNVVRKHLSAVKGGRLAARAAPARLIALVVSDVVGDDLGTIASGPAAPDPSSFADALAVLDRLGLEHPAARLTLERGRAGLVPETPKPGDPAFERVEQRLIVTNGLALEAARASLVLAGIRARLLDDEVSGDARAAAAMHARAAIELHPGQGLVSGGETTTVVRAAGGRGGRNLEFLLALALELGGKPGVWALAADSDGKDGTSHAAGAVVGPDTLSRARAAGLDARAMLAASDAHGLFERLGDLVVTGPTGTNVNDVRVVLRVPAGS